MNNYKEFLCKKNEIRCDCVLTGLGSIGNDFIELSFFSPPYNVGIKYKDHHDDIPYKDYLLWMKSVISEIKRVTKPGGRMAINIDAMTNRQEDSSEEYVRPIYADLVNIGRELGWKFRTEICWYKQNAVGKNTAWGSYDSCSNPTIRRNHEYILVWSNGDWKLDGDSELSDMTKEEFHEYTLSTWFVSPETKNMNNHPVPFPEELAKRVIKLFSYRGNTILDPFCGTGTTCVVAKKYGRNYIGLDNDEGHCKFAIERIASSSSSSIDDYDPRSVRLKKSKNKKEKTKLVDIFNDG